MSAEVMTRLDPRRLQRAVLALTGSVRFDGQMYAEHAAPPGLACLWTRTAGGSGVQRVVPDGCTDLIWAPDTGELFVAGPDTMAHLAASTRRLFGVRFPPGVGPAVFDVPGHVLRDQRVPLAELVPDADRLDSTSAIVAFALSRLHPDPLVGAIASAVRHQEISSVASLIGLSERQLRRRCLDAFGYGPKVLQRVLRFDDAMKLAWAGTPFAEIAFRSGYADQAHLSREVKDLAGVPLGQLIRLDVHEGSPTEPEVHEGSPHEREGAQLIRP